LKTLPCRATRVSVHPPLSQIRIGAVALMMREGVSEVATVGAIAMVIVMSLEHDRLLVPAQNGRIMPVEMGAREVLG
jgi:hypothetical protein